MQVKTVSWKQRSEPPYRRPTTSPQTLLKRLTPPDQTTNQMQSLSRTVRDPFLWMAQTVKCQYPMKRKAPPANTPRSPRSQPPSNAYIPIVQFLTESRRTKKTVTVTRRRRAKRTIWSPQPLLLVIPGLKQILEETTAPQRLKVQDLPRPASPSPVMWTVLMTMVH